MKKSQIKIRFNETGEQSEFIPVTPTSITKTMSNSTGSTETIKVDQQSRIEPGPITSPSSTPFQLLEDDHFPHSPEGVTKAETAAGHDIEIDERVEDLSRQYKRSKQKDPSASFYVYSSPVKPKTMFPSVQRSHVTRMILSIIGAIVTGCLLGYAVLFLFFNPIMDANPTVPSSQSDQTQGLTPGTQTNGDSSDATILPSPSTQGAKLTVPGMSYFVVQGGVFQERSGADLALQIQEEKGMGGIVTPTVPYRLFVGLTPTKESAEPLKAFYNNQGFEVYVKEWTIGNKEVVYPSEADAQNMQQFLLSGNELVKEISEYSTLKLTGTNDTIAVDRTQKIEESYKVVSDKGTIIVESLKKQLEVNATPLLTSQIAAVEEMIQATQNTVYAFREYMKQPNTSYLWNMQEELMNYVLSYEKWYVA